MLEEPLHFCVQSQASRGCRRSDRVAWTIFIPHSAVILRGKRTISISSIGTVCCLLLGSHSLKLRHTDLERLSDRKAIMAPPIAALPRKLWEHPDPKSTNMYRFIQKVNKNRGLDMSVRAFALHSAP
ncbi:hypothetical protein BJ546DRAFT_39054 [Cryomyces antarcticus]